MTLIAVVDHGAGNLISIAQGLRHAGADVTIAPSPNDLSGVDGIVLPGVGATGAAMSRLAERGLDETLKATDVPLLGICVGLQLLFDSSEEDGGPCLGMIEGSVTRLIDAPRLPHIGWNNVRQLSNDPIFDGVADDEPFYFVHSYAPTPRNAEATIATTSYGREFTAAARSGNRVGVQFHPERSSEAGLRVLANFVKEVEHAQ